MIRKALNPAMKPKSPLPLGCGWYHLEGWKKRDGRMGPPDSILLFKPVARNEMEGG